MLKPEMEKQIIDALKKLPYELQKRVKDFTHALLISQSKGVDGKSLLKFSGIIKNDEAEEIHQAIEKGCERVDLNEW